MKKSLYGFKLKKHVNNLKGLKLVSNQIEILAHTISNAQLEKMCSSFYAQNFSLMVAEAELNNSTIFDLDNYVSWLELYGEF